MTYWGKDLVPWKLGRALMELLLVYCGSGTNDFFFCFSFVFLLFSFLLFTFLFSFLFFSFLFSFLFIVSLWFLLITQIHTQNI